ncbi:D-alanyl-D-alanine carboxypeptidase family protein [Streptomyces sp. NPDC058985]|uniref:D-alanyl-D-alanine carboxypeptidase family protein n=1 Tax=Streptomyces sp. NPDC058985 TaxID=3346684 RepID=UPI0036B60683
MTRDTSARKKSHRRTDVLRTGLSVAALITVALGCQALASWSTLMSPTASPGEARPMEPPGGIDEEDGVVPDGTTVLDTDVPAVTRLEPALLAALRRAAADAEDDGVQAFRVNSGWRAADYQTQLLDEAVNEYGSQEEAAKWVATAETSAHVSGDAVDIGGPDATAWLSRNGSAYGLCQTYANEPWHYELRPEAAAHGCPAMYDNPAQDPRTQR